MQKKIYVTIDLSDEIREGFRKEEDRWKNLRVFWTGFSHLHLTLEYLGVVDNSGLHKIKKALQETINEFGPFEVRLDRIILGPDTKEPTMFWATILQGSAANNFRKMFQEQLAVNEFELQQKEFTPHIVLATAKGNQLKGKKTNVKIKGRIKVEHINLFSSQTYAGGITKYKLVETFSLEK